MDDFFIKVLLNLNNYLITVNYCSGLAKGRLGAIRNPARVYHVISHYFCIRALA